MSSVGQGGSGKAHRVTHLVTALDHGGIEKLILSFAEHAERRRFAVRVVALTRGGALSSRLREAGVEVEELGGRGLVGRVLRVSRSLRAQPPSILHTHNPGPHLVGALARRLVPIPVLVHTKHGRNVKGTVASRLLRRWALASTDALVAVSRDAAEAEGHRERLRAGQISVIWNGVDLGPEPAPRPRGSRAICVARLNRIKDHETLLRAARLVADRDPRFELELVGDGAERERVERIRDQLELRDRVRLLGTLDDVRSRLAQANLFVMSSLSEGISLTVLEAMAAGLPAVVTAVGGNPEIVVEGVTGRLVPARDPDTLASVLIEVLSDPARAEEMGRAGRRRVAEHFDIRRMVREYEALYARLLSESSVGRGA